MKNKSRILDDTEYNRLIRESLEENENKTARETCTVNEAVHGLKENRKESLYQVALKAFDPIVDDKNWYDYQILKGHYESPIILISIKSKGIAFISSEGEPIFSDKFLIAVTIKGKGTLSEVDIQWLTELTPIWHPQVSKMGKVELMKEPENWMSLVNVLRKLITYQTYQYDKYVLNQAAAEWAVRNNSIFPVTE